jgi:hypothetical protein
MTDRKCSKMRRAAVRSAVWRVSLFRRILYVLCDFSPWQ